MYWDEENRLTMISDDGYVSNYTYDASGERVIKSHGGSQGVYINGNPIGVINHTDANYTVYVSPYFTMDASKFTKHYYAGSTRVTSKIGNGTFENKFQSGVFEITAGSVNYIKRQQLIEDGVEAYYDSIGIPPGCPTMKGYSGDPYTTGTAITTASTTDTEVPSGWPQEIVYAPAGGPPGAPIQYGDTITNETVDAGFGYIGSGAIEETQRYFFHSDHLGSTSYVTDASGNINQYIAYLPFGETFVEGHSDWDSPYKFNAKEYDSETGLYYYGARYYDAKTSLWIGVDPLAESHPEITSFSFCYGNPINLIDPNGLDVIPKKDVNWSTFDTEKDVIQLDEVVVVGHKPQKVNNNYDGKSVASFTNQNTGKYIRGSHPNYKDIRPVVMNPTLNKTHYDCTGWLSYVLSNTAPNVYKNMTKGDKWGLGRATDVAYYANLHGGIRANNPQIGDVAIWSGHVEIVISISGDSFTTSGSDGTDGVTHVPRCKSFSNTTDPKLRYWGTFKGFWTPN